MNQSQSSRIDFNTSCLNSSRLHIVLAPVGHVEEQFLDNIPAELSRVPLPNRNQLNAKFVLQATPLQSDWSDVQYYRRPIGLLCVAHVENNDDPNITGVLPQYEKIKRRMEATVIDSRCIIFSKESLMLPPDCIRPDIMVIQYSGKADSVHCEELTALIGEFTQALFSVIVRNTIEMGSEKYSAQLLYSPYERSKSGLEDGKTGRRRIQSRHKKHLGDMYLIIGKPDKAHEAYEDALKTLLAIGDSLWVGAAYEGQCCAISRMLQLEDANQETLLLLKAERFKSSQESLNSLSSEPEMKSVENIIRTFRSALNYMEKIREASLIMLESTLKFIRVMIDLECTREACSILSTEIFYSCDDLTAVERLQLFCTIALLYERMDMTRKYCYFLRRAALESIHEKMLSRAYTISSSLLCNVIEKYGVVPGDQRAVGWPQLQKLVLEDLISTSDKLANSDIVVKYGMCLLQNFYSHLDYDDQLRILNLIFKNNTRLGDHVIEVPNIPICKKVVLKPLGKPLVPQSTKQHDSVFIFAPKTTKEDESDDIWWVCNEFGEIHLRLDNPLLHALQLFDIRCVVEGGPVECYPGTITIQPKQTVDILLTVKPRQPGKLKLTGIMLQLCGVPCHFTLNIPTDICVSPCMPLLTINSDIPATVSLYEGEDAQFTCTLVNNSTFPIHQLDVVDNCRASIFEYSTLALPLAPGATADFVVRIDTIIEYEKRAECFDENPYEHRRGTIYENSSTDPDEAPFVTPHRRRAKPEHVFIEELFSVSLKYYDTKKEYFRQTDIQFATQITLLYRLSNYSIVQHPHDSAKCKWYLSLTSICPDRVELELAGHTHSLDQGEQLSSCVEIDRVPGTERDPTCHHRVKHSDLLNTLCRNVSWNIGQHRGSVNVIKAVSAGTELVHAFKEQLLITCSVAEHVPCSVACSVPCSVAEHVPCVETGRVRLIIGQPVTLNLTVANTSNSDVESLLLFVRAYCEGSSSSKKMFDIPFIGTRDLDIDKIASNSCIAHEFSILPLTCGSFYLEVGVCNLPPKSDVVSCTIQYNARHSSASVYDDKEDVSSIIPRKIIMQYLNDGLPPPKYIDSWKMRPSLFFDISK